MKARRAAPHTDGNRSLGRRFWLLFLGESASAVGTAASVVALPLVSFQTGAGDDA
ncbi:hypothetical protein [Streptomyces sp. VNUA24]|uniref:hypothetical protein n=1 Tax=Streptomyces sp. VNUA24 TaxID=3031131 RepID=UPI0023B785A5|nr:hypothetical protein [Streptomyces sp. VNUA24]WEH16502.1 hypothetical protein PYR72_23435 [Streptomyces sp. VNUA24]